MPRPDPFAVQPQLGLSYLFEGLDTRKRFEAFYADAVPLASHPFGLPTWKGDVRFVAEYDSVRIFLLAPVGHTDESVENMCAVLRYMVTHFVPAHRGPHFHLRIVRGVTEEHRPDASTHPRHWLYYEVIGAAGTFIVGGCNDFTGGGGHGGDQLDLVFKHVASTYGQKIEVVTIPASEAELVREELVAATRRHHERRQTA